MLKANIILPIEERIAIINVFSGDPRLKVLAKLQDTKNPYEFQTPTLILERKSIVNYFGNILKTFGFRAIIHSIFSEQQYYLIIEGYSNKQ